MSKVPTPIENNQGVLRFKTSYLQLHGGYDNPTSEYMNVLSMLFSMVGLMLKYKWCAWFAIICSCVNFANARINDESKQIISSFMLSISAVVVTYLQNPAPLTLFNY